MAEKTEKAKKTSWFKGLKAEFKKGKQVRERN